MTFERRRKAAVQERKEFFDADGHFTDRAIEEWIYGKLSYDTGHSKYNQAKAHHIVCEKCRIKIKTRHDRDSGGRSLGVPVGDRD